MNELLSHLPSTKQDELRHLTELLAAFKEVEMVILFGSYARGNWVEDSYVEKGVTYEYRSDFDILVVLTHEDLHQKFRIDEKVKLQLTDTGKVSTPISLIFHGIKQLNASLSMGSYFFRDIKEEGKVLYDSEKFQLAAPKKLTPEQYGLKAQEHFDQWFESANRFLEHHQFDIEKEYWSDAAFHLHQATERYYTTILLVFTDYRPKDHNLENLGIKVEMCDKRFAIFPKSTDEEKRLFELLKRAYVDARYKMEEYKVTKKELSYLAKHVEGLKNLTATICKEKIAEIGS